MNQKLEAKKIYLIDKIEAYYREAISKYHPTKNGLQRESDMDKKIDKALEVFK